MFENRVDELTANLFDVVRNINWRSLSRSDRLMRRQARAMFTTLCLLDNIEADTEKCDELIDDLYYDGDVSFNLEYDDFYDYMVGDLV